MKRVIIIMMFGVFTQSCFCQSQEAQQLLLNLEKLAELKSILKNMYKGYQVLSEGYNKIRDISKGNFELHQLFLDGLLKVNPAVKKYKKVADIISSQQKILKEGKKAQIFFSSTGSFTANECQYVNDVYQNLLQQSIQNLDELSMVLTPGSLRMSDDERLQAIDRIYVDIEEKLAFLRTFNNGNKVLVNQRSREKTSIEFSRKLYGIK